MLSDKIKQQEEENKEYNSNKGGDWFKFQEGENRFRVLIEPEMIFEKFQVGICYTDCGYEGSAKFMTYILNRKTNKIELAKLPYMVGTTIAGYETDNEYKFEGYPMPYDIKVIAVGAGTKEVKYSVMPGRAIEPINEDTKELLSSMKLIVDIIRKMKDNQKEKHIADGTWQRNQEAKAKLKAEINSQRVEGGGQPVNAIEYPEEEINPEDIPF